MLLRALLARRTAYIRSISLADALHTHMITADQPNAAIRIRLALILTAHHAALLIRDRLHNIARLLLASLVIATIPRRRITLVVERGKIVQRMPHTAPIT